MVCDARFAQLFGLLLQLYDMCAAVLGLTSKGLT